MSQPRILFVSHLDVMINQMLPHLDACRQRGWRVEVACGLWRHEKQVRAHCDELHVLPFERFPLHPANFRALDTLTKLIQERDYFLIHAHTPTGGIFGRLAATRARRASTTPAYRIYTAHGFHFHRYGSLMGNTLFKTIETYASRHWCDAVWTMNREDYEAARRGVAPSPDRAFLTKGVGLSMENWARDAVSDADRSAMRTELLGGAAPETLILTFTGEMIPRKRHADVIEALAQFNTNQKPGAVLALLGDGPLMESLKTLARERGVADRVRFLGYRRDVVTILAATDIFVFPSLQEGLPRAIQEALAMEIPVIAANVRGNQDLVEAAYGRLVDPKNPAALTRALAELAARPVDERRMMGIAGRDAMRDKFALEVCIAEWQGLYDQLLGDRIPPSHSEVAS